MRVDFYWLSAFKSLLRQRGAGSGGPVRTPAPTDYQSRRKWHFKGSPVYGELAAARPTEGLFWLGKGQSLRPFGAPPFTQGRLFSCQEPKKKLGLNQCARTFFAQLVDNVNSFCYTVFTM